MKERIPEEIRNNINKGIEYSAEVHKSACEVLTFTVRSFWGESVWEFRERKWVTRKVQPGIVDLFRTKR